MECGVERATKKLLRKVCLCVCELEVWWAVPIPHNTNRRSISMQRPFVCFANVRGGEERRGRCVGNGSMNGRINGFVLVGSFVHGVRCSLDGWQASQVGSWLVCRLAGLLLALLAIMSAVALQST